MSTHSIKLEDWEYKCFQYLMRDDSIDDWMNNFAKQRARKASENILSTLVNHCNENDIALAVGKEAQIDQAFELGIVEKASESSPPAVD